MKTLKVKYQLITVATVICALFLVQSQSFAQTTSSPPSAASLQQQKTDVKSLIASVKFERDRIAALNKKYKADKKAGNETAVMEDQRQLTRADGDLEMAKSYLAAEKEMFIQSYNLAIRAQRDAVDHDKRMLAHARLRLDRDIAAIDEKSDKDAQTVIKYEKDLAKDKEALSRTRVDKDNDILAINKEIKKQNGEFVGSLYAENAVAATGKLLEK